MSDTLKEFANWLGIIGTPSIFAMVCWVIKKVFQYSKQVKILMKAQQAQMRSQLLKDYHKYMDQGWIYDSDLDDWENQYQSYHALGQNGIMDNKRDRIMQLPTRRDI